MAGASAPDRSPREDTSRLPGADGQYANVAVLTQLGRAGGLYSYRVPPHLLRLVTPGSLVRVPFTNRQFQGVVASLSPICELPRIRDIAELLDSDPVVTPHQLRLATWLAGYYAAPMSDVLGAMLPPGLGRRTSYVLEPGDAPTRSRLSADQQAVLEAVRGAGAIDLEDLKRRLDGVDVDRAVASLVSRKLLLRRSELQPRSVRARRVRVIALTSLGKQALGTGQGIERAPRQLRILELLNTRGPLSTIELTGLLGNASAALSGLTGKGMVEIGEVQEMRSPLAGLALGRSSPLPLSAAQRAAFEAVIAAVGRNQPEIFLLHGVTGSGKTEVYLQAIAETIKQGRQAIMMVPEISLTPQAVQRVAGRFPGRVAVLHSRLSAGERLDEWQRIREGKVDIVVGPRSAIFAPLERLGFIVVDEEHDPSYKQDASPRYHGRDVAAVLGRITGSTVVFGSATPDIGTYRAATTNRIKLLELPDRPVWSTPETGHAAADAARPMPAVEIVDLRQELMAGNRGIFSRQLLQALDTTLSAQQQAILFLNRRGNATIILCRDCGFVVRCPSCDIPFTYHSAALRLICHRCDRRASTPRVCPGCASPRIRFLGVGTQKVEEEVRVLYPQARVLRWDRDVTGGKDAHASIIRAFGNHEADILVGTQMIAKGLDFPLVTLVGVVSADSGLHLPDFRAPERAFQLLTQVAGRAGRASLPSRVIVQTYTPSHYAIQAARGHDYHGFYREEMQFRQAAGYPPFGRLIRFVHAAAKQEVVAQKSHELRQILQQAITEEKLPGVELIGPAPCFIARVRNQFFWQLIARDSSADGRRLHKLLDYVPPGWAIDVDPVDLL
ncbi:MAG: replication restart helicase PriA [Chloroflexota bacterium]